MQVFISLLYDIAFLIVAFAGYRVWLIHDISRNSRKYAEEYNLCFSCRGCPNKCPYQNR